MVAFFRLAPTMLRLIAELRQLVIEGLHSFGLCRSRSAMRACLRSSIDFRSERTFSTSSLGFSSGIALQIDGLPLTPARLLAGGSVGEGGPFHASDQVFRRLERALRHQPAPGEGA